MFVEGRGEVVAEATPELFVSDPPPRSVVSMTTTSGAAASNARPSYYPPSLNPYITRVMPAESTLLIEPRPPHHPVQSLDWGWR